MAIYNFKNKETGEIFEKTLRISDLDEFKENNPELTQVILSAPKLVSGHTTARQLAGSEWNDHLKSIKKGAGKHSTINT